MTWEDAPPGASASAKRAQIASLTGLRGLSALLVLVIHVSVLTEYPWLGIPDYGPVSLFVLSGFLLYRPWARWGMGTADRPSTRLFALRRLFRIFPAYLVMLVVVALVYPPARPEGFGEWFRAVTLTWIYHEGDFRSATQQTWSLGTELSWYVALPVMGAVTALLAQRLAPRRGWWLTVALLATSLPVSAGWRWWVHAEELGRTFTYSYWLPGFLFCFACGAMVAHLVEGRRAGLVSLPRLRRVAADPWALPLLALAIALLGTSPLGGPPGLTGTVSLSEHHVRAACATLVATTLLVAALWGPHTSPLNRLLCTRWFGAVGRWSYGIYLWHLPVIVMLNDDFGWRSGAGGFVLWLATILAISIPLGALSWAWVERPAIARSKRVRPAPAAAP